MPEVDLTPSIFVDSVLHLLNYKTSYSLPQTIKPCFIGEWVM